MKLARPKRKRIARVFPTKTTMCPKDKDAYFGLPDDNTPQYDEIHISVTFTWDIPKVDTLAQMWEEHGAVKVGGPAFDDPGSLFISGRYTKPGITITSRGCPNHCPFCFVHKREGKIRELPIVSGNIVQDNNLLACSENHIQKVFQMLQKQKRVEFPGGLEAARIVPDIAIELKKLKIYQLWTAYDLPTKKKYVEKAIKLLRQYFTRNQTRCYVLIGYQNDTIEDAERRLKWVWDIGALPFAMLYHPHFEWKKLQRAWTRPAAMAAIMRNAIENDPRPNQTQ